MTNYTLESRHFANCVAMLVADELCDYEPTHASDIETELSVDEGGLWVTFKAFGHTYNLLVRPSYDSDYEDFEYNVYEDHWSEFDAVGMWKFMYFDALSEAKK